jgi:hydrogenase nickel incorporation protein HypA/HybF
MHELGMCEGIAEAVVRRAAGRRVSSARVRIGGHAVDPEVIDQGFRLAATGTVAEDAALDLVLEPMSLRCNSCGNTQSIDDHLAMVACPQCAGVDIEVEGSDDVCLESIVVDAPAAASESVGSADDDTTTARFALAGPVAATDDRQQGRPPA